MQYLKLQRRKVHDVLTNKKLNNSFLTHLHYYIIISKLLNKINATIYYYYFINWHKSVEYCLEKWETVEVEGENQLKKVGNMKSGENLSISGEQKIIPLCYIVLFICIRCIPYQ